MFQLLFNNLKFSERWRRTHGCKAKDGFQDYLNEFCYQYNYENSF